MIETTDKMIACMSSIENVTLFCTALLYLINVTIAQEITNSTHIKYREITLKNSVQQNNVKGQYSSRFGPTDMGTSPFCQKVTVYFDVSVRFRLSPQGRSVLLINTSVFFGHFPAHHIASTYILLEDNHLLTAFLPLLLT